MSVSFGDFSVKGKIVVVTGGGSGIGLSFVKSVLDQGARVIIADLRLHSDANKVGITVTTPNIYFQICDVTKWDQLENLIKISEKEFGDVPDIFVAAAGVFEPSWSNFWGDPETEKYSIMEINVNHPIKLTRIAIRALLGKDKKGVVLIVGSIAGYSGQYSAPLYSTSKHAIVGFTRSMVDTAKYQGVKVVAICPGIVATPLWSDNLGAKNQFSIADEIMITSETVATSMISLIEESRYSSGTVFEISMLGERVVPAWNIDPPGMVNGKMAEGTAIPQEAIDKSNAPLLAITASERGVSLEGQIGVHCLGSR
ncbi:hypothetical protein BKA61DRAFT_570723 [Leptodontidium sp. MPI-SDFR-AT-0119]|nr:hypothetical protein BKA61DRAFT_570723 [Leptodontidium sp. MPI-SDFR-AT-0119]